MSILKGDKTGSGKSNGGLQTGSTNMKASYDDIAQERNLAINSGVFEVIQIGIGCDADRHRKWEVQDIGGL